MEVVGQVHGTYIIAQNENGMFMIDQHAAQERIKYEYFREKIGEVTNEVQDLLIPLTFHFSKDEQMIIDQYQDELDKVGVHLSTLAVMIISLIVTQFGSQKLKLKKLFKIWLS